MIYSEEIRNEILTVFKEGEVMSGMRIKKFLNEHPKSKEYCENLLKQFPNFMKLANIVKMIINQDDIEKHVCKMCGKPLKIKAGIDNVRHYCNIKCAANDPELKARTKETIANDPDHWKKRREKTEKTNMKRYGCKAPAQNEEVRKKAKQTIAKDPDHWKKRQEKSLKTLQEKYGVENISQIPEVKQKKIQTSLEHFGVEHPAQLQEVRDKCKKTCIERYGVDCQFKRKEVRQYSWNQSWESIQKWKDYVIPLFTKEEYEGYNQQKVYKWKCVKCGCEFEQEIHHTKHLPLSEMIPRCYNCYPNRPTTSAREKTLVDFLKTIYNGQIIENDRKLINPKELDIVIPEKKLAIEFNGNYWHSTNLDRIDENYHLNKTLACEQKGYRLIHIFENDWLYQQEIIKEKLKSIICDNIKAIYARNCQIREIDLETTKIFLDKYHLQGADKSVIKLGLYNNEKELVAVMTFCKPRFNKKYEWELSRYATSIRVIGGAGKLLKYFERKYNPNSLITYADRRYSIGNMYEKIGFTLDHVSEPNYIWVKERTIFTRYQTQKHKLKTILGDKFNENLSEIQNMSLNGYYQVFDCGNLVYIKNYK